MATADQLPNAHLDKLSTILGSDARTLLDPGVARAWIAFLTAYGRVTRALSSELMDGAGMSLADFDVMAQLAGAEGYALRMSELADAAHISKSGLTRRVDRLAINGWVPRRRCTEDGRVHWATLTPLGIKAFRSAAPGHLRAVAERFGASLPASEMDRLTRDLLKIAARNAEAAPLG
ncbi:MAG: MarR family winged helix-turn-helix transcriptional regulator [Candidatus Limnocylindrus sp.]